MIGLPRRGAEATATRCDRVPATTRVGRGRLLASPGRAGDWAWGPTFNSFMRHDVPVIEGGGRPLRASPFADEARSALILATLLRPTRFGSRPST